MYTFLYFSWVHPNEYMCYSLRFDYEVPGLAKSDFNSYAPGSGDLSTYKSKYLIIQFSQIRQIVFNRDRLS
jgi:hypothetical protein